MADELYVDPDGLLASAEVARRQHDHLQRTGDYISEACSQFGAFSGVLNLFEGQYREAVTTAQGGMVDARTVADRIEEAVLVTRTDYLDTDRAAYDDFSRRMQGVADLPPYVPPGSGQSVPGGPFSAPGAAGAGTEVNGFPGLPGVPAYADGPLGRFHESPDGGDLPAIVDPQAALEDEILSRIRDRQTREEYLALRDQGIPADDAYVRATQRSPDDIASDHAYDTMEQRAGGAYDRAYDDAIAAGRTPDEARDAGNDAAAESRSNDSRDHQNRNDILDDGRTLLDTYQGVDEALGHLEDISGGVEQLEETVDDIGDYDDYEDSTPDRSSQEMGGPMSVIYEAYDASAPLAGGRPDGGMGDYIEGLKDDCGFIIPKIDWAVEKLTGWSLLEALLVKIAGDFNALASMQIAWGQVGLSLGATGDNYDSLAAQLPAVWEGDGGTAAQTRLVDVASMHADQQEACGYLQEQLGHILEVAQATAEVVAAAINFIDDVIQELLLDAAVPVLGWAKGAFSAPGKAKRVIDLIHRGLEAIERFTAACRAVVTVLEYVNAGLGVLSTAVDAGNTVASGAAGGHVDETADRGFG